MINAHPRARMPTDEEADAKQLELLQPSLAHSDGFVF